MQIKFALSVVPVLCVLATASYHSGSNRTQRLMRSVTEPEDEGQNLLGSEKISHHRFPKRLTEDEPKKVASSTQTLQLVNNKTRNESFKSEKQNSSLEATIIDAKNPEIQLTTIDNRKFEGDSDSSLNCTPTSLTLSSTTKPVSNKKKAENSELGGLSSISLNCRPGSLHASSKIKPASKFYDPSMHPTTDKNNDLGCHSPGPIDCTSSSLPSCSNEQQVTKNVNHNYNILVTCDQDRKHCSFKNHEPETFFKTKIGRPFSYPTYKKISDTSNGDIPSKQIPFSVTMSSDDHPSYKKISDTSKGDIPSKEIPYSVTISTDYMKQKSEKNPPSYSNDDPANEVFYAEIYFPGKKRKSYLSPNHGTTRPRGTNFLGRNHDHVYNARKYFASDSEKYKQMAKFQYAPRRSKLGDSKLVTDLSTIENIFFDELSHPGYRKIPSAFGEDAYGPKSSTEMPAKNPYSTIKDSGRIPLRKKVRKDDTRDLVGSYRNTRFVST